MPRRVLAPLFVLAVTCLPHETSQAQDLGRGKELFQFCSQCHGADGAGNQDYLAPVVAGQDQWYLEAQLRKFRAGIRGAHPDDVGGLRMYPMSLHLKTDEDIVAVAAYAASLPPPVPAPVLEGGDAERGKTLYLVCAACHGPEGAGAELLHSGPLRGQADWYLQSSLEKFKSGARGSNPADTWGATMRPMASTLVDDQAVKDVIAYIMTLRGSAASGSTTAGGDQ